MISEIRKVVHETAKFSDAFDASEVAKYIVENHTDSLDKFLKNNTVHFVTQAVKSFIKRASAYDYADFETAPKQRVFDFEIPLFLSYREKGQRKSSYILSLKARQEQIDLGKDERRKQASYTTKQADVYEEISRIMSPYPGKTLGEVLSIIEHQKSQEINHNA